MIQVKVHVFNTLLLLKKRKKLSHSVFCDGGTCTPVAGVSPSKISNFSASLKHGLEQVVHLLWWQGHSLLLECFKRRHAHLQEHSLCLKHVSPTRSKWSPHYWLTFQVCVFGIQSGDMEGQERIWTLLLARNCLMWQAA